MSGGVYRRTAASRQAGGNFQNQVNKRRPLTDTPELSRLVMKPQHRPDAVHNLVSGVDRYNPTVSPASYLRSNRRIRSVNPHWGYSECSRA